MTEAKDEKKHAVVLSGGGANGAYEIGVLQALVAGKSKTTGHRPLEPDIFLGTSVGAYNAAFLASQWGTFGSKAVSNLEQIWLERIAERPDGGGNGAFRIRGNPATLLNPLSYVRQPRKTLMDLFDDTVSVARDGGQRLLGLSESELPLLERAVSLLNFSSFVSINPLADLISTTINYDYLRGSGENGEKPKAAKKLRVAATNWAMGKTRVFTEDDMTDQLGPQVIKASTAIPGVFPMQAVGSQPYVDGGVLMNTPLTPAIEAGADVIHVITLNPAVEKIALEKMSNTLATAWRQQVISWVRAVEHNILRIWAMNRTIELGRLTMQELAGKKSPIKLDMSDYPDEKQREEIEFDVASGIWEEIKWYRPLTVYLYRPREDLGGPLGLLDFSRDRLQSLIEQGFKDTVEFTEDDLTYVPPFPIRRNALARLKAQKRDQSDREKVEKTGQ